jgi:membrane associated rhomboid family serine protease
VSTGLVAVNVIVHGLIFITSTNPGAFAISAYQVIYNREYYRIVTAAFTHGGLLHIGMNMMSLLQLGTLLEKSFGSIIFLILSLWSIILCGVLYVLLNWAISVTFANSQSYIYSSAVGYSGVLFSYALISSYHTSAPTQSVFGLFSVPSKLYPWILLGIMQVILPNISMLGHLSGIVVGLLAVYGPIEMLLMPSKDFCRSVDDTNSCCGLTKRPNYYLTTDTRLTTDSCSGGASAGGCSRGAAAVWGGITAVFMAIWNVIATILHIIGCPASVTSLSCCGDMFGKLKSYISNCCSRSSRDGYDEVSSDQSAAGRGFSSMQTSDADVRALRSQRLGGNQAYERVSSEEVADLESGGQDKKPDSPNEVNKAAKKEQINL